MYTAEPAAATASANLDHATAADHHALMRLVFAMTILVVAALLAACGDAKLAHTKLEKALAHQGGKDVCDGVCKSFHATDATCAKTGALIGSIRYRRCRVFYDKGGVTDPVCAGMRGSRVVLKPMTACNPSGRKPSSRRPAWVAAAVVGIRRMFVGMPRPVRVRWSVGVHKRWVSVWFSKVELCGGCSAPSNAALPRGRLATMWFDRRTGRETDFSVRP